MTSQRAHAVSNDQTTQIHGHSCMETDADDDNDDDGDDLMI